MIGRLSTVLLECADLKTSEKFYVEKLGLRVSESGEGWLCVDAGGVSVVLWQGANPAVALGFTGADLGGARQVLEARGVTVGPLEEHPGGRHHYVTDPDGNKIMIADN